MICYKGHNYVTQFFKGPKAFRYWMCQKRYCKGRLNLSKNGAATMKGTHTCRQKSIALAKASIIPLSILQKEDPTIEFLYPEFENEWGDARGSSNLEILFNYFIFDIVLLFCSRDRSYYPVKRLLNTQRGAKLPSLTNTLLRQIIRVDKSGFRYQTWNERHSGTLKCTLIFFYSFYKSAGNFLKIP